MASDVQPGVRGDVPGSMHGAGHRVGVRGVPSQIPGDTVQPREESSQCVYR